MKYSREVTGKIISDKRKELGWSQEKLGKEIGVTGKQICNYEKGVTSPPVDILFRLCETFDCELGFLLGERDYSDGTKIITAIKEATGLSDKAIKNIQNMTGDIEYHDRMPRRSFYYHGEDEYVPEFGFESETYRRILDTFLSSPRFTRLIEEFYELDALYNQYNSVFDDAYKKYGDDVCSEAFELLNADLETELASNPSKDQIVAAIGDIHSAIDNQLELAYKIKIERYELKEVFDAFVDKLYPKIRHRFS